MAGKPLRVEVWGAGVIGGIAIHAVRRRPDLELVGVWAPSPEKVGRDAGEVTGGPAAGVAVTSDKEALIALRPDCVVYATNPPEQEAAAAPDYIRLLERGVNVVTATSSRLIHPPVYDQAMLARIEQAAKAGGASIFASGMEPGYAGDHFPLMLATQSRSIRSILVREFALMDDYPVARSLMDGLGFGMPLDFQPLAATPGGIISKFSGSIQMIADGLGAELQGFREVYEREITPRDLEVACGVIRAGTCGAIRFRCIGVIDGRDAIVIEHVNRMARDVAPDWPTAKADLAYAVEIAGEPDITVELSVSLAESAKAAAGAGGLDAAAGVMTSAALRVVNAIPYVVEACPGVLSALDLPLTTPRHAFAPP